LRSDSDFFQTKRDRQHSDENDRKREGDQISSEVICLKRSDRRTHGGGHDPLSRERQRRAERGLHYN